MLYYSMYFKSYKGKEKLQKDNAVNWFVFFFSEELFICFIKLAACYCIIEMWALS